MSDAVDRDSIQRLAAEVLARFPKLDVVMNNAGIMVHRNVARGGDDLDADRAARL